MKIIASLALFSLLALSVLAKAGPLERASVNRIVNDVKILNQENGSSRPAKVQDEVREKIAVTTGKQSRAELLFQDNTLTRLGADAIFSFQPGTRDMSLQSGTMLLQVPKGLGGAHVRAAAVTAAITGTTIMMENLPGQHVKVLVLEGSLRLSLTGKMGESVVLTPGRMAILGAHDTHMPKPVSVDLAKLVKTSALINPDLFGGGKSGAKVPPLPSIGLINNEIALQTTAKTKSQLTETNLVIVGAGTAVQVAPRDTMASLDLVTRTGTDALPLLVSLVDTPQKAASVDNTAGASSPVSTTTNASGKVANGNQSSTGSGNGNSTVTIPGSSSGSTEGNPGNGNPGNGNPGNGNPGSVDLTQTDLSAEPVVTTVAPTPIDSTTWTTPGNPYPWPNAAIKASSVASPTPLDPPPSALGGGQLLLSPSTSISTTGGVPTMTSGGTAYQGAIYKGSSVDGPASVFLFGKSMDSDAQFNFDTRFGTNYTNAFPSQGVAVFEGKQLQLGGAPVLQTTGGTSDLAVVGMAKIQDAGTTANWDLSSLHSLFVGTQNGPITLSSNFSFSATGQNFDALWLYSRGGDTNLSGSVNLGGARLFLDSSKNLAIASTAVLKAGQAVLNGHDSLSLGGLLNAPFAQLWSNGAITVSGSVQAPILYTQSNSLNLNPGASISGQSLNFTTAQDFNAKAGLITATQTLNLHVGGNLNLDLTGAGGTGVDVSQAQQFRVSAKGMQLKGNLALGPNTEGLLNIGNGGLNANHYDLLGFTKIAVAGGTLQVNNLQTFDLLSTSGDVNVHGNLSADHVSLSGNLHVTGTIGPDSPSETLQFIGAKMISTAGLNFAGMNSSDPLITPGSGHQLAIVGANMVQFNNGGIAAANFDGGDAAPASANEGGDGGTLHVGTDASPITGDVTVNAPINATTGANGGSVATGGKGGTVNITANGQVHIQSTIMVSDSAPGRASRQGGNIRIESRKTNGAAITVDNSGQLQALLSSATPGPGGRIEFISAGGDITVNGGARADKGTVNIVNAGAGNVILNNATLAGDTVKANVLGPNGQLVIGGGTLTADSAIKLYASGSNGTVLFKDNVTLNGNSVKTIAGDTVTIQNGKVVTINGPLPASVYTNHPNYSGSGGNGSTSGAFGGKGATTSTFGSRPGY